MISKEGIRRMLDIADIKTSARLMLLVVEIVELQADLKALESLVQMQYDSHAVDAAKNHVRQQPEYMEINNELKKAAEAVAKAISDPEARLRAMFNASHQSSVSRAGILAIAIKKQTFMVAVKSLSVLQSTRIQKSASAITAATWLNLSLCWS